MSAVGLIETIDIDKEWLSKRICKLNMNNYEIKNFTAFAADYFHHVRKNSSKFPGKLRSGDYSYDEVDIVYYNHCYYTFERYYDSCEFHHYPNPEHNGHLIHDLEKVFLETQIVMDMRTEFANDKELLKYLKNQSFSTRDLLPWIAKVEHTDKYNKQIFSECVLGQLLNNAYEKKKKRKEEEWKKEKSEEEKAKEEKEWIKEMEEREKERKEREKVWKEREEKEKEFEHMTAEEIIDRWKEIEKGNGEYPYYKRHPLLYAVEHRDKKKLDTLLDANLKYMNFDQEYGLCGASSFFALDEVDEENQDFMWDYMMERGVPYDQRNSDGEDLIKTCMTHFNTGPHIFVRKDNDGNVEIKHWFKSFVDKDASTEHPLFLKYRKGGYRHYNTFRGYAESYGDLEEYNWMVLLWDYVRNAYAHHVEKEVKRCWMS